MSDRGDATPRNGSAGRMSRGSWVRLYVAMAAVVALLAVTLPKVDLVKLTGAIAAEPTATSTGTPTASPTATATDSPTSTATPTVTASPTGPTLLPTRPGASTQGSTTANGVTVEVTANPTTIAGPTSVTFTYRITNNGPGDLFVAHFNTPAAVLDDTACSPISYVSGHSVRNNGPQGNRGTFIASGVTATYTCSTTLSATTTSTFRVSGLIRSGTTLPDMTATETVTASPITPVCSQVWYSTVGAATGTGELGLAVNAGYTGTIAMLSGLGSAALAVAPDAGVAYYTRRNTSELRTINLVSGVDAVVGTTHPAWSTNRLAISPTGVVWSFASDGYLYSWPMGSPANPVNRGPVGIATGGSITSGAGDIAFDGLGNMWIVAGDTTTTLYTAAAAELTKTSGVVSNVVGQLAGASGYFNGLAFTSDGSLYGSTPSNLYRVPLSATGTVTRLSGLSADVADLASCAAPRPTVAITKSTNASAASPGGTVTYTVTVGNTGTLAASGVTVQDVLPVGVTYTPGTTRLNGTLVADGSGGAFPYATPRPVGAPTSAAGVIPPGSQAVLTFDAVVGPPTTPQICNTAELRFSGGGVTPTTAQACFTVTSATLAVTKSAMGAVEGPTPAGVYTVRYRVSVSNTGSASGSYGLVETPQFDAQTTVTDLSWTGATSGPAAGSSAPYTLAAPGTTIASGATHTYDVTVTFTRLSSAAESLCVANTPGAGLYNAVTMTPGQGTASTVSACLPAPKPLASIDLVKQPGTLVPNADGTYTATYLISVTNSGNGDGTYGPMTDTPSYDSDLTVQSASWTGPGQSTPMPATTTPGFTLGSPTSITPGQTHSYEVSLVIAHTGPGAVEPCASAAGAGLTNVVTLPPGVEQGVLTNNSACLEPVSRFAVHKTAAAEPVTATYDAATGYVATATYTVTVVNSGMVPARVPAVVDTPSLPAGFTWTSAAVNGEPLPHASGSVTIPEGAATVAPRAEVAYEVSLTATAAETSGAAVDWSTTTCSAEPGATSGFVNSVALAGDSDGDTNNTACVSVLPPTTDVDVRSYARNCGVAQPMCDLPGSSFEVFDGDPRAGGKSVGALTPGLSTPLVVGQSYWIVATQAPVGFQLLPTPVAFSVLPATLEVPEQGLVTNTVGHRLDVLNVAKAELPKAGGSGPMRYALMGLSLFAGAVMLSLRGRRSGGRALDRKHS